MKKTLLIAAVFSLAFSLFSQTKASANDLAALNDLSSVQVAMSNPDYLVTAGDIYTLGYAAGSSAVKYTILVDSSYKIRVSNLTVIDASGKTYLELKKQVEDIVSKNYPMSGVQFVLTTPSSFKVTIKGEVSQTVEKRAWALTRLSDVLTDCFTAYSSTHNIMITGANGKIKTYDLFAAQRYGDLKENPYLRPGDVITVKKADRIVSLSGEVARRGRYELKAGENLIRLFDYYGNGLLSFADTSRIEITRYADEDAKQGKKLYVDFSSGKDFELKNFDEITVQSYKSLKPVMFIEGAIGSEEGVELDSSTKRKIQYEIGTDYADIIRRCAGYFTAVSDIENAYIIRNNEIIPIDITRVLYDASVKTDILIEPYDTLRIPFKQYFVSVAGSVLAPGRYPYIPDRTWDYYIGLAGGFIKTQNKNDVVTIVDINGNILSKSDIITPETTITAATNSGLYYFDLWAPVVTTVLTIISTTLSILAVSGVFN